MLQALVYDLVEIRPILIVTPMKPCVSQFSSHIALALSSVAIASKKGHRSPFVVASRKGASKLLSAAGLAR